MPTFQIILSALLAVCVLAGISMMSKVQTAVRGNLLSALAMLVGVVATLFFAGVVSVWTIYVAVIIGTLIGSQMARKVQMIQMPQTVALFNGLGGGASALVGMLSALGIGFSAEQLSEISASGYTPFVHFTGLLAVAVGMVTLVGSLVAAGKLHRVLNQRPVVWGSASLHSVLTLIAFFFTLWCVADPLLYPDSEDLTTVVVATAAGASFFGLLFAIRVGGADMPITISLLNSLSGVAGSIAGMAISDVFLVAVGGIVGASGLLLTQIMCRAMNRSLLRILVPGFVFFIFVDQLTPHPFHYRLSSLLGVLGMWDNLLSDPSHNIWPGPYWYFGLTLQLYIVYRLLFFRWRTAWLPVGSVLICWALQVWSADDSEWLEYLRYNFVGGMLPFTLGVLMARLWPEKTISNGGWWSVLTVSALLAVLLGFCFHGWLWVPLFVAAAAVALVKLLPDDALRPLIWTGSISAALFVVHPALRKLIIGHYARYDIEAGLLLYIVSAIAVAWLFSLIINRIPRPKL